MTAQRPTQKGTRTLTAPQALAESPLAMFSTVYAACAGVGVDALAVDEMEVWQVAATLQVDMGDDTPGAAGGLPPPGSLSRGRGRRAAKVGS